MSERAMEGWIHRSPTPPENDTTREERWKKRNWQQGKDWRKDRNGTTWANVFHIFIAQKCSELPSRNVFYFPTFWTFPDKRMLFCFHAATPYNSWSAFDMQWSLHNMKQGNWMSSTLLSFCQEDTQLAFDRKLEWRYVTKIWSTRWLTFQGYSTNWDQLGQIAAILRVRLPKINRELRARLAHYSYSRM